jgi:hypothetical protein
VFLGSPVKSPSRVFLSLGQYKGFNVVFGVVGCSKTSNQFIKHHSGHKNTWPALDARSSRAPFIKALHASEIAHYEFQSLQVLKSYYLLYILKASLA